MCKTLNKQFLLEHLDCLSEIKNIFIERPHLFSDTSIYIANHDYNEIKNIIYAIEKVVLSLEFKNKILSKDTSNIVKDFGTHGVFMGYDFHLTKEGPKLIEINTNAGGAYLNFLLTKAQKLCFEKVKLTFETENLEDKFFNIFLEEWKIQRNNQDLKVIAIVDDNPESQFLYPEFLLFSELFKKKGITSYILDPTFLELRDDSLWYQNHKIDLIYNRLTDFYLENEKYKNIKTAYLSNKVVLTPNPFHYAIFANKENLEYLSSQDFLESLKVEKTIQEILLKSIPHTFRVTQENKDELWLNRKNYFFKPVTGFGSKAAYRGDKITLRVWDSIINSSYVAQEFIPPNFRFIEKDGKEESLKFDVRAYTYNGEILLLASRLYMGQTTNFRTQGGGFAPVFLVG
jgi:hypothetical protein